MKKYDSNELKMMIQDIIIADFTQDYGKMYATKSDLFDILDGLCEAMDDMQREISFLSGQLESANNDLRITQLRLENLKKYGAEVPDIRDMYPIMDDGGKFSEQDLPFPDVEDIAPASELLGGDE